ncbi:hypothetical protein [Streptomyces sp. NPDC006997]|uniref:hypothetical protein n=1 Tax=Streptomyces sp. NPDC006997 TaxID=3155356 RepID=UPI0033C7227A
MPETPRLVNVDGVLTEGDADKAREAIRQMDADPHGLKAGMIVKPYTDHGQQKWVFRCWGTDDGCDGWLSLDHTSQSSAESARDRHLAEAHAKLDAAKLIDTPGPWALDHEVHAFAQTEVRRGPLTDEGERWMERRQTGKVMVVCSCGYSSGLIDRTELESTVAGLADEHSPTRPGD